MLLCQCASDSLCSGLSCKAIQSIQSIPGCTTVIVTLMDWENHRKDLHFKEAEEVVKC